MSPGFGRGFFLHVAGALPQPRLHADDHELALIRAAAVCPFFKLHCPPCPGGDEGRNQLSSQGQSDLGHESADTNIDSAAEEQASHCV